MFVPLPLFVAGGNGTDEKANAEEHSTTNDSNDYGEEDRKSKKTVPLCVQIVVGRKIV